jgi:hypothetical protein
MYDVLPEKYHLLAGSNGLKAIDMDYKRGNHLGPDMTGEDMIITSLWCGEVDPFSSLRYCDSFRKMNLKEKWITVDEIASYLMKNLSFE